VLRRRKKLLSADEDVDPMSYTVNIVDCMLVLAVGFMLFAIMSMNMESIVFGDMTPEEKANLIDGVKNSIAIEQGKEITDENMEDVTGGTGDYSQVGSVYEDPKTGKLIMVPN